ncbi:DUF6328 family protein [Cellulomonas wangsupingiae]|uniref:DUF6328 family protein n=1 Tax=Cellulomonas wangsupingiae TaxID=2968085 RepID=A0ABY5K0C8_9CELL|nr:DUF6328 family protein [Cellulomonas wangsupingiae]MCC2333276.1 DUF6328 family protein [Cellulomonas wangsupingiae]UUI63480.1 DUF6328 family protein [Cellulomonas wangsupingiae]
MDRTGGDARPARPPADSSDDGRDETFIERMDRNWEELLQELRVTQTGAQILTGFLLTLPFQSRFEDLDEYQRDVYLVLVLMAALATVLIVAPVSLHRLLFRRRMKPQLVDAGHWFARAGLAALALVLTGSTMLLFDVVLSRTAGRVASGALLAVIVLAWVVLPHLIARRADPDGPGAVT